MVNSTSLRGLEKKIDDYSTVGSSNNQDIVIRDVVRKKLFIHVKFLNEDMLNFDGDVCNFVLTEIGRVDDKAKYRYNFWMRIKPVIKHAINTKRTAVSMTVKERFFSKCIILRFQKGNHTVCLIIR